MKKVLVFVLALTVFFLTQPRITSAEQLWSGDISLGYNESNGNTEKSQLSVSGTLKRMFDSGEFSIKGNVYTASTDNDTDAQTWDALTKVIFDLDQEKKWFNSYQISADHDRFADIDYRITPAVGLGYWFSKEDDWKWMLEGSLGYEITKFRSTRSDEESAVFIAHTYLEKQIFDNARISEDFSVIPTLEGEGTRLKSTTEFTNPITKGLDLSVKYVVDHDTDPSPGKEKTDTKIMTGVKYKF